MNLQWGGAVLEAGNNIKRSWPRFWSVFTQIEPFFFFCPNLCDLQKKRSSLKLSQFFCADLGDLQKRIEKKGLQPGWNPVFLVEITSGRWPILIAHAKGGRAIFVFGAKIGLKSAKNGVFCILFRPMGWL